MRAKLDLNQVRTFVSVVHHGSFSAAARAVNLPTSSVSRHVSLLEAHLGVRLLERNTRHSRTTEAGRLLYERARGMMDDLAEVEAELQDDLQSFRGVLKISIPSEFGPRVLGPAIAEFCAAHPDLELECHTRLQPANLTGEDIDLAITFQRGRPEDGDFVMKRLVSLRSRVVAAPALLTRCGRPSSVRELKGLPCITTALALEGHPWTFVDGMGRSVRVPVSARCRVDSGELARVAALRGIGFAILAAKSCEEDLAAGTLIEVPLDLEPAPLEVVAAYPSRRYLLPKVRAVLDFLAQRLR